MPTPRRRASQPWATFPSSSSRRRFRSMFRPTGASGLWRKSSPSGTRCEWPERRLGFPPSPWNTRGWEKSPAIRCICASGWMTRWLSAASRNRSRRTGLPDREVPGRNLHRRRAPRSRPRQWLFPRLAHGRYRAHHVCPVKFGLMLAKIAAWSLERNAFAAPDAPIPAVSSSKTTPPDFMDERPLIFHIRRSRSLSVPSVETVARRMLDEARMERRAALRLQRRGNFPLSDRARFTARELYRCAFDLLRGLGESPKLLKKAA